MKKILRKIYDFLNFRKKKDIPISQPQTPSFEDLQKRNNEIREKYSKDEKELVETACPKCHCNSNLLLIVKCASCGEIGCENCYTYDPIEKKYFCDNCW